MYESLKPKSLVQCLEPSSINALLNEKKNELTVNTFIGLLSVWGSYLRTNL